MVLYCSSCLLCCPGLVPVQIVKRFIDRLELRLKRKGMVVKKPARWPALAEGSPRSLAGLLASRLRRRSQPGSARRGGTKDAALRHARHACGCLRCCSGNAIKRACRLLHRAPCCTAGHALCDGRCATRNGCCNTATSDASGRPGDLTSSFACAACY